jgi:hypothetical protein
MKMIVAYVQPFMSEKVVQALHGIEGSPMGWRPRWSRSSDRPRAAPETECHPYQVRTPIRERETLTPARRLA